MADDFGEETTETVRRNFYVDDLLRSVATEDAAVRLVSQLCYLLKQGGFQLTKWLSNNRNILASIPVAERSMSAALDLNPDLTEQVLGVFWNVNKDLFGFKVCATLPTSLTRSRVLSVICSLYDPLGVAAPVVIVAQILLQELCRKGLSWHETIPSEAKEAWRSWLRKLPLLAEIELPRCFKSDEFGEIKTCQLHHFTDASCRAYAAVSYLQLVNFSGKIHNCFLIGKARVAPLKICSIPRLELTAVVLAVQLDQLVRRRVTPKKMRVIFLDRFYCRVANFTQH